MRVSHWSPAATSGVDRSGALNDFGVASAVGIFIASGQALAADVELLMDLPVLIVVVYFRPRTVRSAAPGASDERQTC